MAELFQPAPSLAFAHTGAPCSTFNRCRKGTLWEINRLSSTNQSYHCRDFPAVPHQIDPRASCPAANSEAAPRAVSHEERYQHRETQTKPAAPQLTPELRTVQCPVPHMVRPLRKWGGVLGENTWKKFLLLTQREKKSRHVYPTQEVKPCNQLHIKLTSKTASLMYYVLSFSKDKNGSEGFWALLF